MASLVLHFEKIVDLRWAVCVTSLFSLVDANTLQCLSLTRCINLMNIDFDFGLGFDGALSSDVPGQSGTLTHFLF